MNCNAKIGTGVLILCLTGSLSHAHPRAFGPKLSTVAHRLFDRSMEHSLRRLTRDGVKTSRSPFRAAVDEKILEQAEPHVHSAVVASAVSDILLEATDSRGVVDVRGLAKRYGPEASALVRRALHVESHVPIDRARAELALSAHGSRSLREDIARHERVSAPVMHAFDSLVKAHSAAKPLQGFRVVGIQHVVGTTGSLVRGWVASGAEPGKISLLTKPYSQVLEVANDLTRDGFKIHPMLPPQVGTFEMRDTATARAFELLRRELAQAAPHEKILIVDDGAKLIRLVHERLPEHAHRFVAVEQTQKGINELESIKLKFPVVNVAQSWAKKTYEPPMIARGIVNAIEHKMKRLRRDGVDTGKRVLVLGYGAIGRAVAQDFRAHGYRIETYDPDPVAMARAKADCAHGYSSLEAALTAGHLVVSATGRTTVTPDNAHHLPDGAILINAASGDNEIDRRLKISTPNRTLRISGSTTLRAYFRGRHIEIGDSFDPVRQDRVLSLTRSKYALLLNDGFVINFTGAVNPTPPRYIQLTRGLLYLAALKAARETRPGLSTLDGAVQRTYVERVQEDLARSDESLLSPRF